MKFTAVKNTMLYCPKCQQTYEDGVQRFCLNDGGRLLLAPTSGKSANRTGGVFSSVINRKTTEETDEFANAPRFSQIAFRPPPSKIFKSEPPPETAPTNKTAALESELKADSALPVQPKTKIESFGENDLELELEPLISAAPPTNADSILELEPDLESAPAPKFNSASETKAEEKSAAIAEAHEANPATEAESNPKLPEMESSSAANPSEITAGTAPSDDRKINSSGEPAMTSENPQALIGQTVKGRYLIIEQIGADEEAIDYLAEDKLTADKKVVVRVLTDDEAEDSFFSKIFAEERFSLSQFSRPNIVSVVDSGDLFAGKPFVVTEYVKGETIKNRLQRKGSFDAVRTARIIRQAAYALSEVHQSGILHRNLKPENIILTVSEIGAEQVKLTNFGASKGKLNEKNLPYKSPEQVEGKIANFVSDEFALAVIAYQMLTNRLPFNATKIGALLKEQREGLVIPTATLNDNLPPPVDKILAKALAFNPSERYPKVRDFGDALFNAVTTKLIPTEPEEFKSESAPIPAPSAPLTSGSKSKQKITLSPVAVENVKAVAPTAGASESVKASEDLAWEKRSSEKPVQNSGSRTMLGLLGLAILLTGILAGCLYFFNRQSDPKVAVPTPAQSVEPPNQTVDNVLPANLNNPAPTPEEIESFPMPRTVAQPPNTIYFQNSREGLAGDAAKNYLGFSLYYPQNWTRREAKNNFLDVSSSSEKGLPIEQMLVSRYDSKGTFKADRENFPKLLEKSNSDLKKALQGNYKVISQGETKIQNGRWQAFEVKFESSGTAANGEKVTLWGRRLWIPVQRAGLKNGYVITMLATSLSKDVKSVEDVGVKGELSNILETFEPNL